MIDKKKYNGVIVILLEFLILIVAFWTGIFEPGDEILFSLLALWTITPVTAFIVSFKYGKRSGMKKWFLIPIFSLMCILCQSLTFDLANTLAVDHLNTPHWELAFNTGVPALIGMLLGVSMRQDRQLDEK